MTKHRLAFISTATGTCVANPIYESREKANDVAAFASTHLNDVHNEYLQLEVDVYEREFIIPSKELPNLIMVVEPATANGE